MNDRPSPLLNWRSAARVAAGAVAGMAAYLVAKPPTYTIEKTVEIDAPPEIVWRVLTDFARYPEWNPFINPAEGTLWPGAQLNLTLHPGSTTMEIHPTVTNVEPEREIRWLGRLVLPRIFDGEHSFLLEPIGQYGVRVTHMERFSGILVPFASGLLRDTEAGFEAMNQALKEQASRVPWS